MALNLWDKARAEQITRRGEPSNHPDRVQRITDLLHEVRSVGESAEQAIRECVTALQDGTGGVRTIAGARAILNQWITVHAPTIGRSPERVIPPPVRRRRAVPVPRDTMRARCLQCHEPYPADRGLFCSSGCRDVSWSQSADAPGTVAAVEASEQTPPVTPGTEEPTGAISGCVCSECERLRARGRPSTPDPFAGRL